MYTDPILEEKWRVQKEMAEASQYNVKTLALMIDKARPALSKKYHVKPKYASRFGSFANR